MPAETWEKQICFGIFQYLRHKAHGMFYLSGKMVHKNFLWLSFFLCKINIFSKEVQVQTGLGTVKKHSRASFYNKTAQNPTTKNRWKMISARETQAICEYFPVSSLSPSLPTPFNKTACPNVALSTYQMLINRLWKVCFKPFPIRNAFRHPC